MTVWTDPEEQQAELRFAQLARVLRSGILLAELALDAMHHGRCTPEVVQQRVLRHPVVRVVVVGRNAALVAPPELDLAPVRRFLRRLLVRLFRRPAAGEDDVAAFLRAACEPLRRHRGNLVRVLDDDELDVARGHSSPAASSFDRIIAA